MLGAGPGNETGHWEPARLVELHDQMLAEAGSSWIDWRRLDLGERLPKKRLDHFKAEIVRLLDEEYGDAPLIVLKDPRICRFVPLYREVLGARKIRLVSILQFRNPLEVMASLVERTPTWQQTRGRGDAALLWLTHVLEAEEATRSIDRLFASYEDLQADWRTVADRFQALNLSFPNSIDQVSSDIERFLRPDLRHHTSSDEEVALDPLLCGWVKASFSSLRQLERTPDTPKALASLDAVRTELARAMPILIGMEDAAKRRVDTLEVELHAKQTAATQLELRIRTLHKEFEELRKGVETDKLQFEEQLKILDAKAFENTKRVGKLERDVVVLTSRIEDFQGQAAERERNIDELKTALRRQTNLAQAAGGLLERVTNEFHDSTSWKLTAPLRALRNAFVPKNLMSLYETAVFNADLVDGVLLPSNDDPQILIGPGFSLGKGVYKAKACIGSSVGVRPRLYLDIGDGFREETSIGLRPNGVSGEYEAVFLSPTRLRQLRLDPSDENVTTQTTNIQVYRYGFLRRFHYLLRLGLSTYRHDPLALYRRAIAYMRSYDGTRLITLDKDRASQEGRGRYSDWIKIHDYNDSRDREVVRAKVDSLERSIKFSILMPVYNTPMKLLDEAINSVLNQLYGNWELCIANDASTHRHVKAQLDAWSQRDGRIKVIHRTENGHICRATNSAFELASGGWIALLDHDDVLRPHALAEVAGAIAENPDAGLIYSDEDKIDEHGNRFDPHFKPGFSPELFHSMNYFNHLTVLRADLVKSVGGWRPGFEGSQDYDINLRITEQIDPAQIIHIPRILYHWRAVSGSTALSGSEKDYPYRAGFRALEAHRKRTGSGATVEPVPGLPFYRLRHTVRNPKPLVSLIIPTRDHVELLRVAVESILEKTTYPNYEIIIVDNESQEPETTTYLEKVAQDRRVRVLSYSYPFNFSAINNEAVQQAKGDIVGLINNDVEVISPDWLTEMVSWAQQNRIGCVGAKLYYPDNTVQHGGVILGLGGVANHAHLGLTQDDPGYFGRSKVIQNLSAVTGACLIVRKEVYKEVGGLDEHHLQVAFNDVDFCLKVREAGYWNVWTPFAELYHHESLSRGKEDTPEKKRRFAGEVATMTERWETEIRTDPFYSPNMSLDGESFKYMS